MYYVFIYTNDIMRGKSFISSEDYRNGGWDVKNKEGEKLHIEWIATFKNWNDAHQFCEMYN